MNESQITNAGLGDSEVYARILSGTNFWDFSALTWVNPEVSTCRTFMSETPIDGQNSGYSCNLVPPVGGPWAVEIVRLSTGATIGYDLVWGVSPTPGPITPPVGSMVLTVQDIILAQLRVIGVVDPGETPEASMINDAIQANNIMLDSWSAQRLMIRALTQEGFPLAAGIARYTIGNGQTWNTSKPFAITDAFLRDQYGVDTGIDIYTQDQYNARDDKSIIAGRPKALYYDPGYAQQVNPAGIVSIYPMPDATATYTLFITEQKPLTVFVNPTDTLIIEPAYFRAIKFNGAVEMYHEFRSHNTQIPPDILRAARESMRVIKVMNSTQLLSGLDLPGAKRSVFNIMTGDEVQ